MPSLEAATETLFNIWLNDDNASEDVVRERVHALRAELKAESPDELYGNVLHGAYEKLLEYRQGMNIINDITSEGIL